MRKINKIVVHCTATPEGRPVSVEEIDSWHKQRGWTQIGYHYVVQLDGTINQGRPLNISGAHVKGHNKYSIGITYVGGCDADMNPKDTRTDAQIDSLEYLVGYLCASYPGSEVYGHRDFSTKECPSYDAKEEYKSIQDKYVR
jgi:N-acetylmuramoyl-L-alanine amidase